VTTAGVLLLAAGIGLLIAEAHLPTGGALGVAGVVALVFSGLLLYDGGGADNSFGISVWVVVGVAIGLGGLLSFIVSKAVDARRMPISSGYEEMIGAEAEVRVALDPLGQVFTRGALWKARSTAGTLAVGTRVTVGGVDGLTLEVAPVSAPEPVASGAEV
jgi:membrane-bound serine protease (ClpP class)